MRVVFCCDPTNARRPEPAYAREVDAAERLGIPFDLIDHDALVGGRLDSVITRMPKPAVYGGKDLGPAFANIEQDPAIEGMLPELPAVARLFLRRIDTEGSEGQLDRELGRLEVLVQRRRENASGYENALVPEELLSPASDERSTLCLAQLRSWLQIHRAYRSSQPYPWLIGASSLDFGAGSQRLLGVPELPSAAVGLVGAGKT